MIADKIHMGDCSLVPGLAPAVMVTAPILDQLQVSIWEGMGADIVLPAFIKIFGKPWLNEKTYELNFKNGIAVRCADNWGYRIIRFPAVPAMLAALTPVIKVFPKRFDGKPAARLRSAEIAWDFPVSRSYDEAEAKLIELATLAIPANKRARMQIMEPLEYAEREFKKCADGATNGRISFYFKSLSRQADKEAPGFTKLAPNQKSVLRGIIYCKQLAPNEPWGIRFEATILGGKLQKTIGKSLPPDLTRLPRRLEGLCFYDFWSFERFNWDAFMKAARRSAEYKKIPFDRIEKRAKLLYHATSKFNALSVNLRLKHNAKKIARMLKSKSLETKVGAKKFSTRLKSEDVLAYNAFCK